MSVSSLVLPMLLVLFCGSSTAYYDPQVQRLPGPDEGADDSQSYLLPPLPQKYRPHGSWEAAPDPRFYVLTEDAVMDQDQYRVKRNGPSLSIVNSLEVLRQRVLLEAARRRMRQNEHQINQNREILNSIGKRQVSQSEQAAVSSMMTSSERGHANSVGNSRSHGSRDLTWSALSTGERKQL